MLRGRHICVCIFLLDSVLWSDCSTVLGKLHAGGVDRSTVALIIANILEMSNRMSCLIAFLRLEESKIMWLMAWPILPFVQGRARMLRSFIKALRYS
jgi:hypothetical protein